MANILMRAESVRFIRVLRLQRERMGKVPLQRQTADRNLTDDGNFPTGYLPDKDAY
jgi:hypothetical protein